MHMRFPADQVRTVSVHDFEALTPHLAAWDRLAWKSPQKIPTLLPEWIDAFLRHRVAANERWLCSFAYAGGELIGVLPVIISPHPILGHQTPTLSTPFDSFTPSGDIALAPDHAAEALQALLVEIGHEVPGHLCLDLRTVRQNSPVWTALRAGLRGYSSYTGRQVPYSGIDVRGELADYLASLGNLRRNLTRYRKRLAGEGGISVELRKGPAAGEDFLTEFLILEASGWKGRNGTAIRCDRDVIAFYTTLIRNFARKERFEWHILRVQDRVVAAGMGVRCNRVLMLPKIAYDEGFADCMPGNLLSWEVIRDASERPDVDEIYHMSSARWHAAWHMSQDIYTDVHLVRRSAGAMLLHLPRVLTRATYQAHIRPYIPIALKEARRMFQRRGDRKPRRPENKQRSVPHA
jgi:CelD/BcsL family acetyltransferase involved in cellulose biosynthesis